MARQSIGVGSQANDGTGDTLRTGAQKVNSNFNEVYNKLGNGTDLQISITGAFAEGMTLRSNGQEFVPSSLNYNDLLNRPTIPDPQVQSNWIESDINSASYIQNKPGIPTTVSTLSDVLVSGPSIGDALRWNGTGWINQAVQESIVTSLDNLTDVTITSAAVGNIIRFNGTAWVNTALNYSDLYNAPSLSTVATSGDYDDLTNKPDSLAPSRTTASGTTTSINNNFSANLTINGFKTYALYKVETSESAWVTIYTDVNARSNDTSRQETTDPAPGSGIIAEVITTGAETVMLTPGTIGWNNDDPASSNIYLKVVNKSGGPAAITVTLTLLQLEL